MADDEVAEAGQPGLAQALVNVTLVFGVHRSADQVGSITTLVAAFVATVGLHPRVTAVVAPDGSRRPRQSLYARAAETLR